MGDALKSLRAWHPRSCWCDEKGRNFGRGRSFSFGNKKTSPKATDNSRYAGSFVKRNRRRIIVGREDKSALNRLMKDLDRAKARADREGWIDADEAERILGVVD